MSNVRIELNEAGIVELLKSAEVQAELDRQAARVMARLGSGYESRPGKTAKRGKVNIRTATAKARRDNRENNTLLKAIGGA